MSGAEVEAALKQAARGFEEWKRTSFAVRSEKMKALAQQLRNRRIEFGELMAREMGKPIRQGRAEVDKCAWVCDYYAENAESFLQTEVIKTDASKSFRHSR